MVSLPGWPDPATLRAVWRRSKDLRFRGEFGQILSPGQLCASGPLALSGAYYRHRGGSIPPLFRSFNGDLDTFVFEASGENFHPWGCHALAAP